MKVKASVVCRMEIEYEDDNINIGHTKENIKASKIEELVALQTEDSIEIINVFNIEEVE
jgi:hypothetical protein